MGINYKVSIKIFGAILSVLGLAMLLPLIVAIIYGELSSIRTFLKILVPAIVIGETLRRAIPSNKATLKMRDGVFIVSISWILCSIIGCLPFYVSGSIPNFIDALFESCSGFSTTGSTILNNIEALPKAMLFWRAFSHWLGGMGILVFTIALLPALGVDGQQIAAAEVPGPTLSKITPKLSDTARYLYILYFLLTLAETILLMFGGMDLFDALCHSFSSLGTGGFSNYNDSIGHFNSLYIEIIIMLFMFIAGINFNLFFVFYKNGFKAFYKDGEWKAYIYILVGTTLLIAFGLYVHGDYTFGNALRYSAFQDISILTTTGFATADYTLWPTFCQMLIFALLFCGGCSSSTGGSVKVVRVLVLFKMVKRTIAIRLHPNAIVQVKINNQLLTRDTVSNIANFIFLYLGLGMFGAFLLSFDGHSFITSISASFTCLGNAGPGFSAIGPAENFNIFSQFSKLVLSFMMIAGRLELFTLLMLFTRKFWNPFH